MQCCDLQEEGLQGVQARFLSDLRSIQQEFERWAGSSGLQHKMQMIGCFDADSNFLGKRPVALLIPK